MNFQENFTRETALRTKEANELLIISTEIEHPFNKTEVEKMILDALFETIWLDELETIQGYSFNRFSYDEYLEAKESSESLLQFIGVI